MRIFIAVLLLLIPATAAASDCSEIPFDGLFNPESKVSEKLPVADPETPSGRDQIALKIRLAKADAKIVCSVGFKCDTVSDFMAGKLEYSSTLWCNRRSLVYVLQPASGGNALDVTCIRGACRGKKRTYK